MMLEPIVSRYTYYWKDDLIHNIVSYANTDVRVYNIDGIDDNAANPDDLYSYIKNSKVTTGAFLNFTDTNIWKNEQINKLANYFKCGNVKPGDKILFPDAWHSGIIQTKYMSDLTDIPVEIHSLWHAGSYDPQDFLGRKIKDKSWVQAAEIAYFQASDKNYFATKFHKKLFLQTYTKKVDKNKLKVVGFPFEYIKNVKEMYSERPKENIILFPHRISVEKRLDIFKALEKEIPDYKFVVCQELNLSKSEYYDLLVRSKMVFSANLQETLGISCYEGVCFGALPFVPDRLSYKEMYPSWCQYESYLTEGKLDDNKVKILSFMVKEMLNNYEENRKKLAQVEKRLAKYFTMDKMLKEMLE
jgi:glycosyltransferase involved in cell wall biosynthesis